MSSFTDDNHPVAVTAAKLAPPVTVSGASAAGYLDKIPLHEFVLLATLLYTCLQIYFLLKDRLAKRKRK